MPLSISAVAELVRDNRLLQIVRGVLGSGAVPFQLTHFDKSAALKLAGDVAAGYSAAAAREARDAGMGPVVGQGRSDVRDMPPQPLLQVLAVLIHLDDSTADNTSLRVLPLDS